MGLPPNGKDRGSAAKAWLRALELTAPIADNPRRVFPAVIQELAARFRGAPALLSNDEALSYEALAERCNRYARWALEQGVAKGDVVCLFMENRPEYLAIWLGITSVGGIVGLLNTNLAGPSLAHCIDTARPRHLIAAADLAGLLTTALPTLESKPRIWVHGPGYLAFARIDCEIDRYSGAELDRFERRTVTVEDRALYIYTSGTSGLPKAANISHGRLMHVSHWFAGMMNVLPSDRMYDCLPMFHIVGGVQAPGAMLVSGGSVVIRDKFSAGQFWQEIVEWDCTLFQYIGEVCRYLLQAEPSTDDGEHGIRMACGNGLRIDIWDRFKQRFRIPQILEFYGSTEGHVSIVNVEDKPGTIGRIPPYLSHRFSTTLVKFDVTREEPIRDAQGFCTPSVTNEVGEAIARLATDPASVGRRFEGYTSEAASEAKILRDVFEKGDAWYRTGDLMRKDESGYFYFVDRIGDTFRWKGENVSTLEVSEAICAFPGVEEAIVYGVEIPGADGRAGMAALVIDGEIDLEALRAHLVDRLPRFSRPIFLRIQKEIETTATFKYTKADFVREGYEPVTRAGAIYFDDQERRQFVRLDRSLFDRIQAGRVRL
jgi:fatty-acyl-CoA synthase